MNVLKSSLEKQLQKHKERERKKLEALEVEIRTSERFKIQKTVVHALTQKQAQLEQALEAKTKEHQQLKVLHRETLDKLSRMESIDTQNKELKQQNDKLTIKNV